MSELYKSFEIRFEIDIHLYLKRNCERKLGEINRKLRSANANKIGKSPDQGFNLSFVRNVQLGITESELEELDEELGQLR